MLDRVAAGSYPDKPHLRFRSPSGAVLYEECLTRAGFEGAFSMLYHEHRPHELEPMDSGRTLRVPKAAARRGLLRRHYRTLELAQGGQPREAWTPLLFNDDVVIGVTRPTLEDSTYVVNGDGDELYFVLQGAGTLKSPFGELAFGTHDYVVVPKGMLHRFVPASEQPQIWLSVECRRGLGLPQHYRNAVGQLRMDAPYSHRDFRRPTFTGPSDEGIREVAVKRGGRLCGYRVRHSPLDVVGWDGTVYPFALPILSFSPRVGQVHLPPPVHGTFEAGGALICSFVPRLLDFHEEANPCPYPHSSVDVDEVLFYVNGAFGSRRGVGEGSLSFHPAGIPHGPHPDAYEKEVPDRKTEEIAVMLDCTSPLEVTLEAALVEDRDYHRSFDAGSGG